MSNDIFEEIARDMDEFYALQIVNPEEATKRVEAWRDKQKMARRMSLRIIRSAGEFHIIINDPNSGAAGMSLDIKVSQDSLAEYVLGEAKQLEVFGEPPSWV